MQEKHRDGPAGTQFRCAKQFSSMWKNAAFYTLHFRSVQFLQFFALYPKNFPCLDYPRIAFITCNQITEEFLNAYWTCKKISDLHKWTDFRTGWGKFVQTVQRVLLRTCFIWIHEVILPPGHAQGFLFFFFFPLRATSQYIYSAYKMCWFICTCNEHDMLFLCMYVCGISS